MSHETSSRKVLFGGMAISSTFNSLSKVKHFENFTLCPKSFQVQVTYPQGICFLLEDVDHMVLRLMWLPRRVLNHRLP